MAVDTGNKRSAGRPKGTTRGETRRVTLYLAPHIAEALRTRATAEHLTMSGWAEQLLKRVLDKEEHHV